MPQPSPNILNKQRIRVRSISSSSAPSSRATFSRCFSILFGFAVMALGERVLHRRAVFEVITIILKAAPFGAFGAMAYTIGKFGSQSLVNLVWLIASFYLTAILFVLVVLGLIARIAGFSIFQFLAYIKDELILVLGTPSSESALPRLMDKLEHLGCSKSVVGFVVPTGCSFNRDGTNIYITLVTLFIAQALGVDLTVPRTQCHHRAGKALVSIRALRLALHQ
jgi:aerobic C4-dicarboxylate transport protein